MSEESQSETKFGTPQQAYGYVFDQILSSTSKLKKSIFLSQDESMTILSSPSSVTIQFETTKLNISKPDEQDGAYENTFSFTFDSDIISLTYWEAVPSREETLKLRIDDYGTVREFFHDFLPLIEKLNLLFSYFNISCQINTS